MPGLAKVIVVDPDTRAGRQVQLGFEREGVPTQSLAVPVDASHLELAGEDTDQAGLVIVGGHAERGLELVRRVRGLLDADHLDTPLLFAGSNVRRTDAERAGADEVVLQPAYLRDVVTIGRLLRTVASHQRSHISGSLAEMSGVLTLVRALSALGRSAVLTLMRGLRRGEVRFFEGEVTSAQVGLIHGQAALHQLLLWTDARFDFHYEDVVRRQQIPLVGEELWSDAEGFLAGVRDAAGQLSPSIVLEQDAARVHSLGTQIPPEVHGVLRMFDGHRVLADVLEDSPYRVFETLRVTQRAVDAGLLRVTSQGKSKTTWRAVLSIEEWLVGGEVGEIGKAVAVDPPVRPQRESQSGRSRTKRRANTPLAIPVTDKGIDWGQLVPRSVGAEVGPLAGVVPAAQRSGEISLPATREAPREKLESLMDTGARERIFPRDLGVEPSIVLDDPSGRMKRAASEATRALENDEWERAELEARRRVAETGEQPPSAAPNVHALPTEQLPPLAAPGSADDDVTQQRAKVEADELGLTAHQREAEAKERAAREEQAKAKAKAQAEADARARRIAKQKTEAEARARRDAEAKAQADAALRAEADARVLAEAEAKRQAALAAEAAAHAQRDEAARQRIEAERIAAEIREQNERAAAREIVAREDSGAVRSRPRHTDPGDLVRRLVREETDGELDVTVPRERIVLDPPATKPDDVRVESAPSPVPERLEPSQPSPAERTETSAPSATSGPRAKLRPMASVRPDSHPTRTKSPTVPPSLPGLPEPRAKSPTAPPDARSKSPTTPPTLPGLPAVRAKAPTTPPRLSNVPGPASEPPALPAIPEVRAKSPTAPPALPSESRAESRAKSPTAPPASPTADTRSKAPTSPPSERKRAQTHPASERRKSKQNLPSERGRKRTSKPHRAITTPPVIVEETPLATVSMQDVVTISGSDSTAQVVAVPLATVREAEPSETAVTDVRPAPLMRPESSPVEDHPFVAAPRVPATGPIGVAKHAEPAMQPIEDEPSDGVVRPIDGETSSRPMPPPPKLDVVDDRPAAKTGEISSPGMRKRPASAPPAAAEPSILIHDLSTIHDAVAAIATAQAAAPPTPDAKSDVQEGLVSAVRKDATGAFTKAEEDFFREGYEQEKALHRAPVVGETFDDLDDGYQPSGFWDRLRGKKKKKKR